MLGGELEPKERELTMKISNKIFAFFTALLISASVASNASAQDIIYNAGAVSANDVAYGADAGGPVYTANGNTFIAPSDATATTIQFTGLDYNPGTFSNSFAIRLYNATGGSPSTLLTTSTLSNVTDVIDPLNFPNANNSPFQTYQGTLDTPFVLTSGASYFVDISNLTTPYGDWLLAVAGDSSVNSPGTFSYDSVTGSFVRTNGPPASFELLAAPEPSTWAMLLGGLGLLALQRFRSRRI